MKTKIQNIAFKTNAFGGLNLVYPVMEKSGFMKVVDSILGERPKQSKYSYSQVLSAYIINNFAGAQRLEHSTNFKKELDNIKGLEIPSPDTTGRIFKELAIPSNRIPYTGKGKSTEHLINFNEPLNDLLIQTAIRLKQINPKSKNIVDFDNTVVGTQKRDATKTYKRSDKDGLYGYQPALASLNGCPFFVEGRSGHTAAMSFIDETTI